jgi:hypothetical protein
LQVDKAGVFALKLKEFNIEFLERLMSSPPKKQGECVKFPHELASQIVSLANISDVHHLHSSLFSSVAEDFVHVNSKIVGGRAVRQLATCIARLILRHMYNDSLPYHPITSCVCTPAISK